MNRLTLFIFLLIPSVCFSQYVPEWANATPLYGAYNYNYENIAFDQNENMYTCVPFDSSFNEDKLKLATNKFNSTGNLIWTRTYPPNGDTGTACYGIFTDSQGNICVIGGTRSHPLPEFSTLFFVKYDNNGNLLTSSKYNFSNRVVAINSSVFDNNSSIYVTGSVDDNYNQDSIFTAKISTTGQILWTKNYAVTGYSFIGDKGTSIKLDPSGNVYITGSLATNQAGKNEIITMKYSSSGSLLWFQTHSFFPNRYETGNKLVLDNNQNVYITGASFTHNSDSASANLLKYNSNGQLQWANHFELLSNNYQSAEKLLLDNQNNLFSMVKTRSPQNPNTSTYYVIKLNSGGQQQWFYTYPTNISDIQLDNNNNLLLIGSYLGYFRTEAAIQRVNGNGVSDWLYRYTFNDKSTDFGFGKVYSNSKILLSGYSYDGFLLAKLTPSFNSTILLSKNSVNKPITDNQYTYDTINFNLPTGSFVKNVFITLDSIIHPYASDLEISLVHSSREDTLVYRRGGSLANFIGTNLSDTSTIPICNTALPPYTGYYKPCKPLVQFISAPANGPWILKIRDWRAPNTGTLKAWKINLQYESPIGITQISSEVPKTYLLSQNYPNPFNPVTKIRFDIPKHSQNNTVVKIFDILGRELTTLVDELIQPGQYEVTWDASAYPSGVYFYTLSTGEFSESKKMILVK